MNRVEWALDRVDGGVGQVGGFVGRIDGVGDRFGRGLDRVGPGARAAGLDGELHRLRGAPVEAEGSARGGPGYPADLMPSLLDLLAIDHPIIQAPMAGMSTPAMAAEVANAGALGSLGLAAMDAAAARAAITATHERSSRSINVNVFCHRPARADAAVERAWIERLRPEFERFGTTPPESLRPIYKSFVEDDAMLAMLVAEKPPVVSFHFGAPPADRI